MAAEDVWNAFKEKEVKLFAIVERRTRILRVYDPNDTGHPPVRYAKTVRKLHAHEKDLFREICLLLLTYSYEVLSAYDVEIRLRREKSNIYLLARPVKRWKLHPRIEFIFGDQKRKFRYEIVTITTKDKNDYWEKLQEINGLSIEENQEKLKDAGYFSEKQEQEEQNCSQCQCAQCCSLVENEEIQVIESTRGKCLKCDRLSIQLKVCARCKHARYCSKECQRADWESHKKQCTRG